jgi:glyoxylase-like metal-dependent hydrolase (beta-lactamase superfamily II)
MFKLDILVQGFPGRAVCHGGLGWSTISLLRGAGRVALLDVGAFGVRRELRAQLTAHGVSPEDVTDVILTHAHYDHAVNFVLFPNARVWIGDAELRWAAAQPPGFNPLPELYVRELVAHPRLRRIQPGEAPLPGLIAVDAAGHTPGHLYFVLDAHPVPVIFTGDAAKNRAELLSLAVDQSEDHDQSRSTLESIWSRWRSVPGTLLVPGHDLTMSLDAAGNPLYLGERKAAIAAWFSESIHTMTQIDLCCPPTSTR